MVKLPGEHPYRQRKVAAQPDDLLDDLVLSRKARPGSESQEQAGGVLGRQRVQADDLCIFERGQVFTASDQNERSRAAGKERADLLVPLRVIENEEQPFADKVIPPEPGPWFQAVGNARSWHAGPRGGVPCAPQGRSCPPRPSRRSRRCPRCRRRGQRPSLP